MSITTGNHIDAYDGDMNTRDLTNEATYYACECGTSCSFKKDVSAG